MNKFKKVVALLLAFVMTLSLSLTAFAANDKGITYDITFEDVGETVVMTINASEVVATDTVGGQVIIPDGWSIAAIENETLGFVAGDSYDLAGGYLTYADPVGATKDTQLIVKVTYNKPADFSGSVELGVIELLLCDDTGMNMWEDGLDTYSATYTAGPAPCDHDYADATCTAPATCTKCGETTGEALGHDYADATCTAPATCTVCGATTGEALGHDYADATCTAPATCTVCGATTGDKLDHDYQLEGFNYVCSACGDSYAAETYTVEFLGYNDNVVYTAKAVVGYEISAGDIAAAEAVVAATAPYGYEFAGFDGEIAEGTVGAKFSQADVKYTVNIIGLTGEATKSLKFDTALTVTEPNVAAWKVNGVIVAAGESVTLYVAGDMTIEAVEEAPAESSIAIIGKADNGKATVMAKAYIAGAVEYKTGVDYTLGDRTVTVYSKNNTAIDFMTGLNNAPAGIEAKAFIEIAGVKTYSAAVTFY